MSKLIETLKKHHVEIISILEGAKEKGLSSQEGKDSLIKGKRLILAHLGLEDAELYPKLAKHEDTKRIGQFFSEDMKGLAASALELFERIEKGNTDIETAKLLGKVTVNLKLRIQKEERDLYPAYEKVAD